MQLLLFCEAFFMGNEQKMWHQDSLINICLQSALKKKASELSMTLCVCGAAFHAAELSLARTSVSFAYYCIIEETAFESVVSKLNSSFCFFSQKYDSIQIMTSIRAMWWNSIMEMEKFNQTQGNVDEKSISFLYTRRNVGLAWSASEPV